MKLTLLTAAALTQLASAHYFFDTLVIDGKDTKSHQYVRENTRPAKYNPTKWENVRDDMTPESLDFRCNKGSFASASRTQTAEVKAGSKLAMKLAVGATMQHPGPALVYMSKAPSTASAYEGDGEWFKIYETGVCDQSKSLKDAAWCTWDKDRVEFTIPKDLPDGEYLIRPEHIGVHGAHVNQAEFYYSCAQVKVVGGGSGKPGPTVKFPSAYKKTDPSFNFSVYNGYKPYPMPGPQIWTGGNSGGAGNATEEVDDVSCPVESEEDAPAEGQDEEEDDDVSCPVESPEDAPAPATTLATITKPTATPAADAGSATAQKYAQCGGQGYSGPTACASGSTCTKQNDYYSQCI